MLDIQPLGLIAEALSRRQFVRTLEVTTMEIMLSIANVFLQLCLIIMAVDFVGGFVHWAEDTFWTADTPIVGKWLVAPNIIHHQPSGGNYFLRNHWAVSSWDLLTALVLALGAGYILGIDQWQYYAFMFVGVFSQQIHRFSHSTKKNPSAVRLLQKLRIIQDGRHHWKHHAGDKNTHYCVVTPWLNPVLDRWHFWRGLERVLVPIMGSPRREDIHRKSWYSKPIVIADNSTSAGAE